MSMICGTLCRLPGTGDLLRPLEALESPVLILWAWIGRDLAREPVFRDDVAGDAKVDL